jgi:hypothetical protein
MPARLAIHVPTQPVAIHVLPERADWIVGRVPECDCVIAHDSVSRRHARVREDDDGRWLIEDLGSKNGIRVDGHRVASATLGSSQWLAIGDVFCEFEPIAVEAVTHLAARAAERRHSSQLWIDRLAGSDSVDRMMDTLLRGIVEIAECQRGFLLVVDAAGAMRVSACHAIDAADFGGRDFSGSRSAVDRSIVERRPVFLSDRRDHDWLADKASVVARGIRALVSLPLQHDGRLLGIAYADSGDDAKVFTDLDAELLAAFAERAANALAALEIDARLAHMESAIAGATPWSGRAPTWTDVALRAESRR